MSSSLKYILCAYTVTFITGSNALPTPAPEAAARRSDYTASHRHPVAFQTYGTTMPSAVTYILYGDTIIFNTGPNTASNMTNSTEFPNINQMMPTSEGETKRDDYTYTPDIGGHKIHTEKTDWNTARLTCEDEGGHLAIINSDAEAEAIVKLLKKSKSNSGYLGVHDMFKEGEFVTIHGDPLEKTGFTAWRERQPDNDGHGYPENCLAIFPDGKLNDIMCGKPHAFVCELPDVQPVVIITRDSMESGTPSHGKSTQQSKPSATVQFTFQDIKLKNKHPGLIINFEGRNPNVRRSLHY